MHCVLGAGGSICNGVTSKWVVVSQSYPDHVTHTCNGVAVISCCEGRAGIDSKVIDTTHNKPEPLIGGYWCKDALCTQVAKGKQGAEGKNMELEEELRKKAQEEQRRREEEEVVVPPPHPRRCSVI